MFAAERDRLAAALGDGRGADRPHRIDGGAGACGQAVDRHPGGGAPDATRDAYRDPLLALGYVHHPTTTTTTSSSTGGRITSTSALRAALGAAPPRLPRPAAADAAAVRLPGGEAAPGRRARRRPRLHGGQDAGHSPPPGRFYPAAMTSRRRLDAELVERGLAENRSRAQALVMAGRVTSAGGWWTRPAPPSQATPTSPSPNGRATCPAAATSSRPACAAGRWTSPASAAWTWAPPPAASRTACCSTARPR